MNSPVLLTSAGTARIVLYPVLIGSLEVSLEYFWVVSQPALWSYLDLWKLIKLVEHQVAACRAALPGKGASADPTTTPGTTC